MLALAAINEGLYDKYEAQERVGLRWEFVGEFTTFKAARAWFEGCASLTAWKDRGFRLIARKGTASKVALCRKAGA